jgi:hypothetical protein
VVEVNLVAAGEGAPFPQCVIVWTDSWFLGGVVLQPVPSTGTNRAAVSPGG